MAASLSFISPVSLHVFPCFVVGGGQSTSTLFLGSFSVMPGSRANRRLTDDVITSKLNISHLKPTKRSRLPWFTCITQNHHDLGFLRPCCPMTHSPTCRGCSVTPAPRYTGVLFPEAVWWLGPTTPEAGVSTRLPGTISRGRSFKTSNWNSTGFCKELIERIQDARGIVVKRMGRGRFWMFKAAWDLFREVPNIGVVSSLQPSIF